MDIQEDTSSSSHSCSSEFNIRLEVESEEEESTAAVKEIPLSYPGSTTGNVDEFCLGLAELLRGISSEKLNKQNQIKLDVFQAVVSIVGQSFD